MSALFDDITIHHANSSAKLSYSKLDFFLWVGVLIKLKDGNSYLVTVYNILTTHNVFCLITTQSLTLANEKNILHSKLHIHSSHNQSSCWFNTLNGIEFEYIKSEINLIEFGCYRFQKRLTDIFLREGLISRHCSTFVVRAFCKNRSAFVLISYSPPLCACVTVWRLPWRL